LSSAGCASVAHALSAAYYADSAQQYRVTITQNEQLARDTYRVRFECPQLGGPIVPGQFLMLRLAHDNDPLLGRPFALYDTVVDSKGIPVGVDVVYLVVGKMTAQLANCKPGDELDVWGPLGNGFSAEPVDHLIMVAGGIGQTPFLALGREFLGGRRYGNGQRNVPPAAKVTMCYGVRSKDYLAGVEDFRQCGIDLKVSSDDGSAGHHGLVTELLETVLTENSAATCRIACCGPERMMEAVAGIARVKDVPCEVSLETPMACGIGICFSCVVRTEQPGGDWDYKRTCVEGPVFDARKIVW
jgi:dihydroorotate dehydrogenase electron transfer subunit